MQVEVAVATMVLLTVVVELVVVEMAQEVLTQEVRLPLEQEQQTQEEVLVVQMVEVLVYVEKLVVKVLLY
jgi:hypothetical protein